MIKGKEDEKIKEYMMTQQINTQEFESKVKEAKGLILVDFFATWCGPCKMLAPTLEELSQEGYEIYSIDVDQEEALAASYNVMSIPTLVFFKDGQKVDQMVGLAPKSTIQAKLDYYSK